MRQNWDAKSINMNKKLIVKASLFTIILAFMVGGMFAIAAVMKKEVASAKQTPTTYYYNGPSTNLSVDIMDSNYWSTTQNDDLTCDHPTEIPCSLSVEAGKSISQKLTELQDLAGIQAATLTRRNESF